MKHSDFLRAVGDLERELGELIDRAHAETPATVQWVATLTWASCARGSLMSLVELGPELGTDHVPLVEAERPAVPAPDDRLECLFCTSLREPDSKFCLRHAAGVDSLKAEP